MPAGFDYSKWDNIEFSSDEDEKGGHPNIDQKSLVRMKRRQREQKKAQEAAEVSALEQANRDDTKRIGEIAGKLGDAALEEEEKNKLKKEMEDRSKAMEQRHTRLKDIADLHKYNWDSLCKVKDERSIVNHIDPKEEAAKQEKLAKHEAAMLAAKKRIEKAKEDAANGIVPDPTAEPAGPEPETIDDGGLEEYITKHTDLMKKYGKCSSDDKAQEFLEKNTELLDDHASSWLLIYCLELEIAGKHALMRRVARNQLLLQYLLNLAKSMAKDPREAVGPFFRRATVAAGGKDDKYVEGFETELEAFVKRVQDRAKVKIKEAEEEIERDAEAEKEARIKASPGGLDPQEVYESLPEAMQKAFDSQVVKNLQDAVAEMTEEDAGYHMKRCIDSGLWCP